MKRIFFVTSFLLIINFSYAQFVPVPSWGVKGGINLANIGGEETDNALKMAIHAGVYGQKHFNSFWHINLALLVSGQGHGAKEEFDNKLNILALNLPVVVEYAPRFNLGFHAGLQPGILLSVKTEFDGNKLDVKDQFTTADLGLVIGGTYYLMDKKVALNLRYVHGLSNISISQERYNRVIQISASYMIARLFEEE